MDKMSTNNKEKMPQWIRNKIKIKKQDRKQEEYDKDRSYTETLRRYKNKEENE